MPKSKQVYLSPSSLQAWFDYGCPAAWNYSRQYVPKDEDTTFLDRGSRVHTMLAKGLDQASRDSLDNMLYQKIVRLIRSEGLEFVPETAEKRRRFEILEGVFWTNYTDRLAWDRKGETLIVDYKTAGAPWKQVEGSRKVPQALSVQATGYVFPDPKVDHWPKRLVFLVAPLRGEAQAFYYRRTKQDEANLLSAIHIAAEAIRPGVFPKIRSRACKECPFRFPCFDVAGWQKRYTTK